MRSLYHLFIVLGITLRMASGFSPLAEPSSSDRFPVISDKTEDIREEIDEAGNLFGVQEMLEKMTEAGTIPHSDVDLAPDLESEADFEDYLRSNRNDYPAYIRHCLEMLRRFPPSKKMPFYLWSCASKEDQLGRTSVEAASSKALPTLLELCARLPKENRWYQESEFIRAEWLLRQEKIDDAGKLLDDLLELELGDDIRYSALYQKGLLLERQEKYEEALAVYNESRDAVDLDGSGFEGQLRAVFLNLALDHEDAALEVIGRFKKSQANFRGSNAPQVYQFIKLGKDPEAARAYWKATKGWWKEFVTLEKTLGGDSAGKLFVPMNSEMGSLDRDAKKLGKEQVLKLWARSVHGARWLPDNIPGAANMATFGLSDLFPNREAKIRSFAVSLSKSLQTKDEELIQQNLFLLTVNQLELDRTPDALKSIRAYMAFEEKNPLVERAMIRLWAMAANISGKDLPEAIKALEGVLASGEADPSRPLTVNSLLELYRKSKNLKAETALLKREMKHPTIKQNPELMRLFRARYKALIQVGEASAKFSKAVRSFREDQHLDWWDYAKPGSLKDPELKNLERVLKNPDRRFTIEEQLKLFLLVAEDQNQPFDRRSEAWSDALRYRDIYMTTHEASFDMYQSVMRNEDFPEQTRREALLYGLLSAVSRRNVEQIDAYRSDVLFEGLSEWQQSYVGPMIEAAKLDWTDLDVLESHCEKMAEGELNNAQLGVYQEIFSQMIQHEDLDRASTLYDLAKDVDVDPDARLNQKVFQLALLKKLSNAKELAPLHEKIRGLIFERFPEEAIEKPDGYTEMRHPGRVYAKKPAERNAFLLWRIKTRSHDATMSFWHSFIRYVIREDRTPETTDLAFKIMEASLELTEDDLARARLVQIAPSMIDIDDPPQLKRLTKIFKPYRDAGKNPITFTEIRFGEIEMDLRLGKKINLEDALSGIEDHLGGQTPERIRMQYYLQTKNKTMLKRLLGQLDVEDQLSTTWLSSSIQAYEILGMKAEASLARDSAKKEIYKSVLSTWADPEGTPSYPLFELIEHLGEPHALPEGWFKSVQKKIKYGKTRDNFEVQYYQSIGDWENCIKAAKRLVKTYPSYYDYHGLLGRALFNSGKKAESAKALRTYIKYCKSDLKYPDAIELLKEAEKAELLERAL